MGERKKKTRRFICTEFKVNMKERHELAAAVEKNPSLSLGAPGLGQSPFLCLPAPRLTLGPDRHFFDTREEGDTAPS